MHLHLTRYPHNFFFSSIAHLCSTFTFIFFVFCSFLLFFIHVQCKPPRLCICNLHNYKICIYFFLYPHMFDFLCNQTRAMNRCCCFFVYIFFSFRVHVIFRAPCSMIATHAIDTHSLRTKLILVLATTANTHGKCESTCKYVRDSDDNHTQTQRSRSHA